MACPLVLAAVAAVLVTVTGTPVYFVANVVTKDPPSVNVVTGPAFIAPGAATAAWGVFNDTIESTGWSTLDIHTVSAWADNIQAYAAGFAEGVVTQQVSSDIRFAAMLSS